MVTWRYGITYDQWEALFNAQGKRCAICASPEPRGSKYWALDHCHVTGRLRGILCAVCNLAVGHFADSVQRLEAAIAYLTREPAIVAYMSKENMERTERKLKLRRARSKAGTARDGCA